MNQRDVRIMFIYFHFRTVFERGEVKQNFSSSATKQSVASRLAQKIFVISLFFHLNICVCVLQSNENERMLFRTSSKSLVTFSSGGGAGPGGGGKPIARVSPGNISLRLAEFNKT